MSSFEPCSSREREFISLEEHDSKEDMYQAPRRFIRKKGKMKLKIRISDKKAKKVLRQTMRNQNLALLLMHLFCSRQAFVP